METILIVEDEKHISDIIKFNLEQSGYNVLCQYNGADGLECFKNEQVDLILLDMMMPIMNGLETCKEVRRISQVPIIMLTAKADESDKIAGLDLGADDYVTKPFSNKELIARIKANLRRITANNQSDAQKDLVHISDLSIDYNKYEVYKNGTNLNLTKREFELVAFLASQKDQVFSREELLSKVWDYEYLGDLRTVDVTIRRLRTKIEDNTDSPKYILTKRGLGYYFGG